MIITCIFTFELIKISVIVLRNVIWFSRILQMDEFPTKSILKGVFALGELMNTDFTNKLCLKISTFTNYGLKKC